RVGYGRDSAGLHDKLPLIEDAIALAEDSGQATACLFFIELVKARALSSALSVPASGRNARTELETEFDEVTQRLDALEYRGYSGAADGAAVRNERAALLARRIGLMGRIWLCDPRWRGLTTPPTFSMQ